VAVAAERDEKEKKEQEREGKIPQTLLISHQQRHRVKEERAKVDT
jgi:hypothetical protein